VSASLYFGVVLIAWLLLKHYDEPLRAWLTRKTASWPDERLTNRAEPARS